MKEPEKTFIDQATDPNWMEHAWALEQQRKPFAFSKGTDVSDYLQFKKDKQPQGEPPTGEFNMDGAPESLK